MKAAEYIERVEKVGGSHLIGNQAVRVVALAKKWGGSFLLDDLACMTEGMDLAAWLDAAEAGFSVSEKGEADLLFVGILKQLEELKHGN